MLYEYVNVKHNTPQERNKAIAYREEAGQGRIIKPDTSDGEDKQMNWYALLKQTEPSEYEGVMAEHERLIQRHIKKQLFHSQ